MLHKELEQSTGARNGQWWRGTFPMWIVAVLLAIISFFAKEAWNDLMVTRGKIIDQLQLLNTRVALNEQRAETVTKMLEVVTQTLKDTHERLIRHEMALTPPKTTVP